MVRKKWCSECSGFFANRTADNNVFAQGYWQLRLWGKGQNTTPSHWMRAPPSGYYIGVQLRDVVKHGNVT